MGPGGPTGIASGDRPSGHEHVFDSLYRSGLVLEGECGSLEAAQGVWEAEKEMERNR